MTAHDNDNVKHRELHFHRLHEDPRQAQTALLLLSDIEGIEHLRLIDDHTLAISYDLNHLCLRMLEEALEEAGFHLDNSLLCKLKRAWCYYTEEVQRENLGITVADTGATKKIFISRYERLQHGCRDSRPEVWRRYL